MEQILPIALEDLIGPQGPQGDTGPAGRDGKDGLNGKDGSNGKDGRDGKDGEIPKELAVSINTLSKTALESIEKLAKLNGNQLKELLKVLENKTPPPVIDHYKVDRDEQGLITTIVPVYKQSTVFKR